MKLPEAKNRNFIKYIKINKNSRDSIKDMHESIISKLVSFKAFFLLHNKNYNFINTM